MWRSILAVFLLPSLTAAQAAPEVHPGFSQHSGGDVSNHPLRTNGTRPASYQAYTRYTAIRQGSEEDAGIVLMPGGFVTAPGSPVSGIEPLRLKFEPLDGFSIGEIYGPKVWKSNFKIEGEDVKVSAEPYLYFKIRADRNSSLGPHVLRGRLTFQKVPADGSSAGPVEQVDVQIPFTVVESNAKVQKANFPYGPMPGWQSFLLFASIPVLIALFIPLFLFCTVTGTCPEC